MLRTKKTKDNFKRDEKDRVILGSAKEMAAWVELGFENQDKRKSPDIPFEQHFIDLRKCILYISYPIGNKNPTSQIFNLCDMAGEVNQHMLDVYGRYRLEFDLRKKRNRDSN